jgi:dihydroorotase
MRFDLLIKGGHVLDPAAGYDGRLDVAVNGGVVAAVDSAISHGPATQVLDATDRLVTPGLIDLHTHIYPGATYWGIHPDPVAATTGVSTWVDAGSAGAYSVQALRDYLDGEHVRGYAFLNISFLGLVGPAVELRSLDFCDVALCVKLGRAQMGFIRGVKVRLGAGTSGEHGNEALRRALDAATQLGLPLMVHISQAPPEIDDVLELLRPGDLLTHSFTAYSMRLTGDDGAPRESVRRAVDRGVLLDMGHGGGGFSFEVAEAMAAAGILPHVLSTDLHQTSLWGPVYDLPTCLAKGMVLGMSLPDAIRAATDAPAQVLGLQGTIGTLRPGAKADIALFERRMDPLQVVDTRGVIRTAPEHLRGVLTLIDGRPLVPQPPNQRAPWIEQP